MDEEQLKVEKKPFINGYFTLSNKVIQLSDSISSSRKKRLFNGLKKIDSHMHFILIGQLGKYIGRQQNRVDAMSGSDMLDRAFEIIYQVKERITCNCVLIECRNDIKIRKIYEEYGFKELQRDKELVQYFKII